MPDIRVAALWEVEYLHINHKVIKELRERVRVKNPDNDRAGLSQGPFLYFRLSQGMTHNGGIPVVNTSTPELLLLADLSRTVRRFPKRD